MKIVRIRKLDDIADNDWEITLENEGKVYHNHKHFFEIVEMFRIASTFVQMSPRLI